ncbi:GIY-YIG nuclease family protein [Leptospira noguchii]|uniref:T5orf172 domain protein n=1 Tax=Leptospira noguchii serovar Panama str. CZ214 TaxID=1001595 RepID=T0FMK0_9LEPT|nr:GIY-YIG nuclease family protein [Leptospira noguchii]EQA70750.1 T5orf172 domain protein [Leptospira noguchii serovar Panama str. CZ214]
MISKLKLVVSFLSRKINKEKAIKLKRSDIIKILTSIKNRGGDYYSKAFNVEMPLDDQVFVFEYYAETGIDIVPEWFLINTFLHLVYINFRGGAFNIENVLINEFDSFLKNEELPMIEKILNGDGAWDFDQLIDEYGLPKKYCWLVYDIFLELSGENRTKVVHQIYKKNAESRRLKSKNQELMAEGFIYIISDDRHYKIGITKDVEARFQNLQTSTSSQLKIIYSEKLKNYRSLEKKIHKKFAHKRIKGEWFDLVDEDVIAIKTLIGSAKS